MCGIVGYTGYRQAAPILLDELKALEYRGYDSAGLSVFNEQGVIEIVKAKGRLRNLCEKIDDGFALHGTCGIGHTRWATHGEPSETNAHPHHSYRKNVIGVHNGIIENAGELKEKLLESGYEFYSQTDSEVAVNLIEYYLDKYRDGPVDALARAMLRIRGSYALAVLFVDEPDAIYTIRKDSPLILGLGENQNYLASDVSALLDETRSVYYVDDLEIARLDPHSITFFDLDRRPIEKEVRQIEWDLQRAQKDGFRHYMMKEIHEQPEAVRNTLKHYLHDEEILFDFQHPEIENLDGIRQIIISACGSAYHVALSAQYLFEDLVGLPVRVELASEFRYRPFSLNEHDLVIVISQSGETADSIAALRLANERGARTLAVVNVVGSTIAREADEVFYTVAGPEIAVATTKAYSTQLIICYLLALFWAMKLGQLEDEQYTYYLSEINSLPGKMERLLEDKDRLQWFASKFARAKDMFFIGRGIDYTTSLEGSLKMKEISYIHSEAYAAGELKHGAISLIEDGVLTIGILTQPDLYEKTLSNMQEVKSRGGYLMGLTTYGHYAIEDHVDFTVYIPKIDPHFATALSIVPLQLLSYYVSVAKGLDVDQPRNLAKSVTVE